MEQIKIKYFNDKIEKIEAIAKGSWIDLRAAKDMIIKAGERAMIPLGIAMELPIGYEALLVPRSSTFKNFGIIQTNHMGVIDGFSLDENGNIIPGSGFCGDNDQWHMPVLAMRDTEIHLNDRICQFRIQKKQPKIQFIEVDKLDNADRGGFGTTGTK